MKAPAAVLVCAKEMAHEEEEEEDDGQSDLVLR